MDSTTYGAATSALFSAEDEALRWFQLVAEQVDALAEDANFDDAEPALHQAAETAGLAWAAEALSDFLRAETQDPVAVLRQLGDPAQESEYVEASLAAAAYAQETAGAGEPASEPGPPEGAPDQAADVPFDEAAWAAYLSRWQGGWDGAEESWPAFKEGFRYYAPAGLRGAAEQLLLSAEAADKAATLTPYGIPAAAEPPAGTAPNAGEVIAAVLQDRPELGELGAERLQELFAEVAAELAAERQAANHRS